MGRSVKKIIKNTLKIAVLLCVMSFILLVVSLSTMLGDVNDKLSASLKMETSTKYVHSEVEILEEYSTFSKEDFINYNLFSTNLRSGSDLLQSYKNENKLLVKGKFYLAQKDIELSPLAINNCEIVFCYQHKIKFSKIPSQFWKGLMGIEDYRFLDHIGVDPISILRAIITDIKAMKLVQGGSTLTQQLVKNLYFTNKKTFTRKIKEIIIAILLESKYEKEEILESYFNEVFWGSYKGIRVKGIYAASLIFFGKKPRQISKYETALLIGMLKGPAYYSPLNHFDRIKKRSKVIYKKLTELGLFPSDHNGEWSDKDFKTWKKWLNRKNGKLYLDTLWQVSKKNQSTPLKDYENFTLVLSANSMIAKLKKKYPDKDITSKIYLKSIRSKDNDFRFYSKYERRLDEAMKLEKHQVGSTLKPILYYIFNNFDRPLSEYVSTKKVSLKLKSGIWTPRESHIVVEEEVTLENALLQSLNRPVIRIANEIGFENIEEHLLRFLPNIKTPLGEYPSQLLGAIELSMSELWEAYRLFIHSSCLETLVDGVNSKLFEDTIISKLSNPNLSTIRRAISKHLKEMRFFGKTGTSNNGLDNWYIFFDGKYLGVIWTGLESMRNAQKLNLYGSTTSFKIYENYLLKRGKQVNELNCDSFE